MKSDKITDAEYEIVQPAYGKPRPWWRRLYIDPMTVIITATLLAVGLCRYFFTDGRPGF